MKLAGSVGAVGVALLLQAQLPAYQVTIRESVSSLGAQADTGAFNPAISADGRFVAFASAATTLVPGDVNGRSDVFVKDLRSGAIDLASVSTVGAQGNQDSPYPPSISGDGRFVAFVSNATNLVAGDTNGDTDVFVRDRQTGTTERVSRSSGGAQGNGDSGTGGYPSISDDGRFVAFSSLATNLVAGDTNGVEDIFVHDRQTGTTERVSVSTGGTEGNGPTSFCAISADGRYVGFGCSASNLVPGDTNGFWDVFLRDRTAGTTTLVSVSFSGGPTSFSAGVLVAPRVSGDGRYVLFESAAFDIVAGDANGVRDFFVRDLVAGTTELVSVSTGGVQANFGPSISFVADMTPDGRFVTWSSKASNLVAGDTNGLEDVFVRDRQLGTTERWSVSTSGVEANAESISGTLSDDGRRFMFQSLATNLVTGDTNAAMDAFLRDTDPTAFTSVCDPGIGGVTACPCGNPAAGLGRGCDNSASTGGASLSASGVAYLSLDSLVFQTSGEKPTATSILLQGDTGVLGGIVYGQGVRCVGGTLKRLFTKAASGGSITAPDFGLGDPTVSARSAAKGDVIQGGESRWYLVFYRDPIVLGGCPPSSTFNATQTGRVIWSF